MVTYARGGVALARVLASSTTGAFTVQNHEALPRAGAGPAGVCAQSREEMARGLSLVGENEATLVGCNVAQDSLIRKVLVWHFYSPDRKLEQDKRFVSLIGSLLFGEAAVRTTLHEWFARLNDELDTA